MGAVDIEGAGVSGYIHARDTKNLYLGACGDAGPASLSIVDVTCPKCIRLSPAFRSSAYADPTLRDFITWCRANGVQHFESPEASFVVQPSPGPPPRAERPKDETDEQRLERELFPT